MSALIATPRRVLAVALTQYAVDISHSQAEEEMEMGKGPASREEWREGIKKRPAILLRGWRSGALKLYR